MPNKYYVKGRRKEYRIVREFRNLGYDLVQRTASSHSKIDILVISRAKKEIILIQSKPEGFFTKRIEGEMDWLNDTFTVKFLVK